MGIYLKNGIEVNTIYFQQEAVWAYLCLGLCVNVEEEVDETVQTGNEEILWEGCIEKGQGNRSGMNLRQEQENIPIWN